MARVLIDGRFVGVGDSQTRYVLELVRNILRFDQENEYTLLIRPQGIKDVESWLKIPKNETQEVNKSEIDSDVIPAKAGIQDMDPRVISLGEAEPRRKPEDDKRVGEFLNLQVEVLDIPHYSVPEQTKLLKYLNDKKYDLVHFTQFNHPIFYRGNYIVTIQDLTLVGHLHYFNFVKQLAFNNVMKSAARDSKAIIAISKVTEKDVIDFFGTPKEKFTLIYHGIDHSRFKAEIQNSKFKILNFKEKYHITGDYILYTGMWKKHKNLLRMLKAFEKLQETSVSARPSLDGRNKKQEKSFQLVLTGKIDKNEPEVTAEIDRINSYQLKTKNYKLVVTTGFIDEEELPIAYAGALAYCIPSLSEGFGWPPLEAMACGTPVISSNVSCMPEILGDAALYFDPYNIDDMTAKMGDISTDEALRKTLISKGLEQVKKYSWEECAKKTLAVYKKLLK